MFDELSSLENLWTAWKKVRANGGVAGGDGLSGQKFSADPEQRLARLSRALRDGSYRPGPLRKIWLRKAGRKPRLLRIPSLADRVVQTSCQRLVMQRLDHRMSDNSFAYRPARSVAQALALVRELSIGREWLLDADIAAFFDRLPHAPLRDDLAIWLPDRRVVGLIGLWLRSFGSGRGLAQGAPISPVLANLYLHPLDMAFVAAGLCHVRYADDFIVLCRSQAQAQEAQHLAGRALHRRGLALSPAKTRIVGPGGKVDFLGARLVVRPVAGHGSGMAHRGGRRAASG